MTEPRAGKDPTRNIADAFDALSVVPSEHYERAFRCKRCGFFLMAHDMPGHDRWHEDKNR